MHILSVTPSNIPAFDNLAKNMKLFVKIYHPSCGHCIDMKSAWDKLANDSKNLHHNAGIVEIHADTLQSPEFKQKYPALTSKAQGYPTLMILKKGGIPGQEYSGDRSYEDMLKFCKQHLFSEKPKKTIRKKPHHKKKKGGKSKRSKRSKKR